MSIQAVLFDLDGTLADTAPDLALALNNLLIKHNKPIFPLDALRPFASHGSSAFVKMGFGENLSEADFQTLRKAYLAEYELCFDQKTVLFDQIDEMLKTIYSKGLVWGIITNKPMLFTDKLVPKLGFTVPPSVVVSADTTSEPKPSTKPMFYACDKINIAPENCLYVGDAQRDIQAGRNANMKTVLVNWGYIADTDEPELWGADFTIDNPMQLIDIIDK